jgi:hypothetical protein
VAAKHAAVLRSESFTLKNRSLFVQSRCAQFFFGFLIAAASLFLSSCHSASYYYYKFPEYTFANRPVPASKLANRVMVSYTANGTQGGLQMLDALRDIRNNVEDTIKTFPISGYSSGYPSTIFNFPEEVHGYVYSDSDGSLSSVDYTKETASSSGGASYTPKSSFVAIPEFFAHFYAAEESAGQLIVNDNSTGRTFALNLPNVYKVFVNQGDTIALAMVRNSNTLYRILKLNANQFPTTQQAIQSIGAVDCQPYNVPVYCVVPVASPQDPANLYDRPTNVYFSLDGNSVYILNCGPECGGTTASVTILQPGGLNVNTIPTTPTYPSVYQAQVLLPGGATTAVSDGTTLYVAGQQLLPDGLFAGNLSTINLATNAVNGTYSISDGTHTKILFADDNTLWIGSQFCATGERAKLGLNYNCLTRFDLGAKTASIVPAVTPGSPTATVPYPNTNNDLYYYGSLTGLCWVQNLHKVYTAYGGQVHAFNTADGSEINNFYITVQGTALDVAYMDAITNAAN